MKRRPKPHEFARVVQARGSWFAATVLGATVAVGLGCTGTFGAPAGSNGTGARGAPVGARWAAARGLAAKVLPVRGAGGSGIGGQGGDPYAIPTSPPAPVLVPTSRFARLSRQQWSNTVRDLLKLTDISEIDRDISGDALHGFDSEGDALFVTEQLRLQFAAAAEKLADKVIADADRARPARSRQRAHRYRGAGPRLHHLIRTARVPAAAHRRGDDHAPGPLQSGRRRSTRASTLSRRASVW